MAWGQRGWKEQPGGNPGQGGHGPRDLVEPGPPLIPLGKGRDEALGVGVARAAHHIPGPAFSTISPAYMTAIFSVTWETTARSWVMRISPIRVSVAELQKAGP